MHRSENPRRILIVDDDVHLALALRRLVSADDRIVDVAHDVASGSRFLREHAIDVLVCDYDLPDGRGSDVFRCAVQHQPDTPRILLTGHADWDVAERAVNDCGIDRALSKPCDPTALRSAVEEAISLKTLRDGRRELKLMADGYARELAASNQQLRRDIESLGVEVERCKVEVIEALLLAAELRRAGARQRARATAAISAALGAALGLPDEGAAELRAASLLHEVGIVGIGDDELEPNAEIDRRPRVSLLSASIIARLSRLQPSARIVRHHRERFEGGGVPDGLLAEAIPFGSRILAVATRYRELIEGRSHAEACEVVAREAGTDLDPAVVAALTALPAHALLPRQS
ncbi:MAG: response regulator [Deltaproteobacteria bacterium]|nr:response regulator [Deltaproteobacteria bacterium]